VHDDSSADPSLMKGRVKAGEQGNWCHRLERLVHLELSDLVMSEVYLESDFRAVNGGGNSYGSEESPKKAKKGKDHKVCSDCRYHSSVCTFKVTTLICRWPGAQGDFYIH
jgi:hypothetical protein